MIERGMAGARVMAVLILAVAALGCSSTTSDIFRDSGSLQVLVRDGGLRGSALGGSGFQAASWILDAGEAVVEFGDKTVTMNLVANAPCSYLNIAGASTNFAAQCGGVTNLAVNPDLPITVTVRLSFSRMELRRGSQPDLPPGLDYDGDGVANDRDNCPLVANPGQELELSSGMPGACSTLDLSVGTFLLDSDADLVVDLLDNCVAVANPQQEDADADGIGDACELSVPVLIPGGAMELRFPAVQVVATAGTITDLIVEFDDSSSVTCNPDFTSCTLDPTAIQLCNLDAVGGPACVAPL